MDPQQIELIWRKGRHQVVRFPRSDQGGDGYWYRSETWLRGVSLGSTYDTLAEAERDFFYITTKEEV